MKPGDRVRVRQGIVRGCVFGTVTESGERLTTARGFVWVRLDGSLHQLIMAESDLEPA